MIDSHLSILAELAGARRTDLLTEASRHRRRTQAQSPADRYSQAVTAKPDTFAAVGGGRRSAALLERRRSRFELVASSSAARSSAP